MSAFSKIKNLIKKVGSPVVNWVKENVFGVYTPRTEEGPGGIKTHTTAKGTEVTQVPKLDPKMQAQLDALLPDLINELQSDQTAFSDFQDLIGETKEAFGSQGDMFAPLEQLATQKFEQQIIPGLAERFTSMGGAGQRSGAFARQATQAGQNLATSLAALKGELGMKQQRNLLDQTQLALKHQALRGSVGESRKARLQQLLQQGLALPYDTTARGSKSLLQTGAESLGQAIPYLIQMKL